MARNLCNILLLALCFGSFASARLSEGGRVLQDNGSITDNIKDFFTDDRCLRTEKGKTLKWSKLKIHQRSKLIDFFVLVSFKIQDLTNLLDLSNWMSSIENADSLRLMDMTIPGSHNSNSYDLTTDLNINDPEYTEVKDATFGLSEDIVSQWICDYALTQSLSLSEQLQAGIRYLDLRIDYDAANLQFRASHMLYGLNAEDLLNQIANFATGHPKEIVFVEFGPIYAGIPAETKQEFQRIITNAFAGVLIPTSTDLSTVTLGQLQNGTANVFVIVSDDVVGNSTLIWHDQDVLENTYSNTDDVETMVAFNKARIDDFKAQNNTDTFYKIQWILTPTANYIRMNP
jgi:hypothetical protein